jgi:hypothetical protein
MMTQRRGALCRMGGRRCSPATSPRGRRTKHGQRLIPRKHTDTEENPMTTQTEHAQGPAVVRVAEMVGVSTRGWEQG